MAANVSSNDSLLHPNLSSVESSVSSDLHCWLSAPSSFIYLSFFITYTILLLPPCILVLYLGLQRWRQQRSTSTAAVTSHSDSFTYHMVTMELVGVSGSILGCYGIYSYDADIVMTGFYLYTFTWFGEMFFHVLTCVERYLAVVHPITYLSLRNQRGIRIRNFTIGCVWLFSVVEITLVMLEEVTVIVELCLLFFSLVVISFCSLSVLCALIRPGPGEQGGDRERVDQSKRRAFYTITVILGVLFVRCGWNMILNVLLLSVADCVMTVWPIWFNLPASLVLPLLFLLKAGRLTCRKSSTKKDGD